jgi:hypothetical protein
VGACADATAISASNWKQIVFVAIRLGYGP